jgi:glycerophosphoryl diester phosphodiesterase
MGIKQLKKKFAVAIIGHRGYKSKYPENTLLGFQKAMDAKADAIELDVHSTKDGQIVVCHDKSTKRTGSMDYNIQETNFDTLRQLDMGQGEKMPTLQEVMELCKGKMGIHIEIKQVGIVEKVAELITKNDMLNEVAISCFHHGELAKIKAIQPDVICAVLEPTPKNGAKALFKRSVFLNDAKKVKADAIHPFTKFVNKKFLDLAHKNEYAINPWTVDSEKEWKRLIILGVEGIITNDPDGLCKLLEK